MPETTISETIARFATRLDIGEVPAETLNTARHLVLDGVGAALAARGSDFARAALASARDLGAGKSVAIGLDTQLALRDAVLVNGVLIHGLDFDDTHLVGVVHATSSCFPTALGLGATLGATGRDVLLAYLLGMEVSARVGMVARGELNQVGFHPTGVAAAFGCAVAAARLYRLDTETTAQTQGIVLSMAAGTREYSSDGSGSKRLHPGWASVSGITAANLAKHGSTGPRAAYEGRFGLYKTHLQVGREIDLDAATRGLGEVWETRNVAVKPFPSCQLNIACIDAAIALHPDVRNQLDDIVDIEAVIPPHAVAIVCEPAEGKRRPSSSYKAQFSLYFSVACALVHGRLGLAELELFADKAIGRLAERVRYCVDHETSYPVHFPGEVILTFKDGTTARHREPINRGASERPITPNEIREKYDANARLGVDAGHADAIRDAILSMDTLPARELSRILAAGADGRH